MKGSSSKSNKSIDYKIIAFSVLGAYTMTFILFVILSLLLYITELSESLIPSLVMAISAISILVCGISVTRNVSNLGWLHGGNHWGNLCCFIISSREGHWQWGAPWFDHLDRFGARFFSWDLVWGIRR